MGQICSNDFTRQEHENHIDGLGNWQVSNTKEVHLVHHYFAMSISCTSQSYILEGEEKRLSLLAPTHVFQIFPFNFHVVCRP